MSQSRGSSPQTRRSGAHQVAIPGGRWSAWRLVGLRGTGFPATQVLDMAAPRAAAAIDAALAPLSVGTPHTPGSEIDRETRAELEKTWSEELEQIHQRAAALAVDPMFREAITWQNRPLLRQTLDPFARDAAARGWKARQRLALIARYLQRYCTKNETIGFFGPVGWAHIRDDGPAVTQRPGPAAVSNRKVALEQWGLDEVARALSARFDIRPWARPRLQPFLYVDHDRLLVPGQGPVPLPPEHARLLRACDGTRSARDIAAEALARGSADIKTEGDVYALMEQVAMLGAISWTLELPVTENPEVALRELLETITDEAIRQPALAAIDGLIRAKEAVAAAAGDPAALDRALDALEKAFTAVTGSPPTRKAGEMWAARTLIYEDCQRDTDVGFGPALLEHVGPALTLLLDGFRWFTWRVAQRYVPAIESMYDDIAKAQGATEVELTEVYHAFAQKFMMGGEAVLSNPSEMRDIVEDFQRRWFTLVGDDTPARVVRLRSSEIAARARELFAAPSMGWPGSYLTPNLSVAARGADAFAAGDFTVVLGKVHPGNTVLKAAFVDQHPDVAALERALLADHPTPHVAPIAPRALTPRRTSFPLASPSTYWLHFSPEPPNCQPERLLRVADLVAYRDETGVRVKTRDGRLDFGIIEMLAGWLAEVCHASSNILPNAEHQPRLMIDDLIVERERWTFDADTVSFAREKDALEQFVEARRWAKRLGLPRYVFAKIDGEPKPIFLDFASPVYVDIVARAVRAALTRGPGARVSMTEMQPTLDELWLTDQAGRLYSSELLLVTIPDEPA